jgi:GntR family transcriptional regulator
MEDNDMHIILNNTSMVPIYEQLVNQVKNEIINGELAENEALPSVRALSGELRISALTVKKAYDKLEEEGFVITVHGKGTFVAATDKSLAMEARRKTVEDDFAAAIQKASAVGFTKEDILEIVQIILEEN